MMLAGAGFYALEPTVNSFADGVWLVELAPISDPVFLVSTIADVLDMTVDHALEEFKNYPQMLNKLKLLQEVGVTFSRLRIRSVLLEIGNGLVDELESLVLAALVEQLLSQLRADVVL